VSAAAPGRRLLARLIDEQALEAEPIAEVRADLAALGIDPTRTIALSRRLAANANSPAAALLRRISESEEEEDEIRRLEQTDIGAVRQDLPQGVMAAAALANAQRAAGRDSNVVGLRRRRSRRLLLGLSGGAAAVAASLVLYVGLSVQPRPYSSGPRSADLRSVAPTDSEADAVAEYRVPPLQSIGESTRDAAEPIAAAPQQRWLEGDPIGSGQASDLATDRLRALQKSATVESELQLSRRRLDDADLRQLAAQDRIRAFLVVTPSLLPDELLQRHLPPGHLLGRLEDARQVAAGEPVAALVTLEAAGGRYDAAVIAPAIPGEAAALRREAVPAPASPAVGDYRYRIIPLPDR
jgi:hypothetical protein